MSGWHEAEPVPWMVARRRGGLSMRDDKPALAERGKKDRLRRRGTLSVAGGIIRGIGKCPMLAVRSEACLTR